MYKVVCVLQGAGSESLRVNSTMLSNNTLTPLTFRLKVGDPFLLVDLDPENNSEGSSKALSTSFCTLNPNHNLMVSDQPWHHVNCTVFFITGWSEWILIIKNLVGDTQILTKKAQKQINHKVNPFKDFIHVLYLYHL